MYVKPLYLTYLQANEPNYFYYINNRLNALKAIFMRSLTPKAYNAVYKQEALFLLNQLNKQPEAHIKNVYTSFYYPPITTYDYYLDIFTALRIYEQTNA